MTRTVHVIASTATSRRYVFGDKAVALAWLGAYLAACGPKSAVYQRRPRASRFDYRATDRKRLESARRLRRLLPPTDGGVW